MGHHVAAIPFSSAVAGPVFALVHPGGLLVGPARITRIGIEGLQDIEVRLRIVRYPSKASNGTEFTSSPMTDGGASAVCQIRTGTVAWPVGSPNLAAPMRRSTRGAHAAGCAFEDGALTLAPNRTLVVETLDPVPSAAVYPLTFVIAWEE